MWQWFSRARRLEAADRERHQRELQHLEFLRDEIFAKPDIARMYWHTLHPGDLKVLSEGDFNTIAGQLRPEKRQAPATEHPVAGLLREFLAELDNDERAHLIRQLGKIFSNFQRDDLTVRLNALPQDIEQEADA